MSKNKTITQMLNDKTGYSGLVKKYINWLIPTNKVKKGINLLKVQNSEHLYHLIKFNYEIRSLVLHEFIQIEGFITTRITVKLGNQFAKEIDKKYFKSQKGYDLYLSLLREKFGANIENKKIIDLFEKITFGSKVKIISWLSEEIIKKWFLNKKKISKKEFIKTLRLSVELRNKAAHDLFISYSNFINIINITPPKGEYKNKLTYYYERINLVLSIFGEQGIDKRIKKIKNKYKKYLSFDFKK